MDRKPFLSGGVALVVLIAGYAGIQWYRGAARPTPVVVAHAVAPDPRSMTVLPAAAASAPRAAPPAPAVPASASASQAKAEEEAALVVHVVGAVRRPGVYRLRARARLMDAVHAAGGAKAGADLEAVNLASFVQDGEQIRVPTLAERRALRAAALPPVHAARRSRAPVLLRPVRTTARYPLEAALPPQTAATKTSPTAATAAVSDGLVNVNTANAEELDSLPGVGPATAAAILEYRREHGPFQRAEDLLGVRGIGEKKLARMRDRVVVR